MNLECNRATYYFLSSFNIKLIELISFSASKHTSAINTLTNDVHDRKKIDTKPNPEKNKKRNVKRQKERRKKKPKMST